jgi:hypothetical protein
LAKKSPVTKKKLEQAELSELRAIQITLVASEANLQRIAAMLLFADHLEPKYELAAKPLPWEDPNDPQYQKPPALEIDYNAVRNGIMKDLEWYVAQYSEAQAKEFISLHGAERIRDLTEDQLLTMSGSLAAEIKAAHE